MKMIKAIIRPERVEAVKEALESSGIAGLTVYDVMGRGAQKGLSINGGKTRVDLLPKTCIETVVEDSDEMKAVSAITAAARTGKIGDGRIFVMPVGTAVRIRTAVAQATV